MQHYIEVVLDAIDLVLDAILDLGSGSSRDLNFVLDEGLDADLHRCGYGRRSSLDEVLEERSHYRVMIGNVLKA